jgi:Cupin domain
MPAPFANVYRPHHMASWLLWLALLAWASTAFGAEGLTVLTPDGVGWVECGADWPKGCEAALVAGDPAKGTSFWYCRAPKGYLFPRHSHTGAERIVVLRGRISGGVDGGNKTMAAPGMYLGFDGGAVHWARCEDDCLMYIIHDGPYDQTFH